MGLTPTLGETLRGAGAVVVGSPEAFNRTDPELDQASFRRYLQEARRSARLGFSRRFSVSVVGPDQRGQLAGVTNALALLGCNVEAASSAVLSRFGLILLAASAQPPIEAADIEQALRELQEHQDLEIAVSRVLRQTEDDPLAGYVLWNFYAEANDRPGVLHAITAAFAEEKCWLLNFSTHVAQRDQKDLCVLDLNIAVPPDKNMVEFRRSIEGVWRSLEGGDRWSFRPTDGPMHTPTEDPYSDLAGRFALTIEGEARPGLVASVTGELANVGFDIVASSMAILEHRTAMVMLLDPPVSIPTADLVNGVVSESIARFGLNVFSSDISSLKGTDATVDASGWPLFHFYGLVEEKTGVVADLAQTLAHQGATFQRLLARVIGHPASCVVNADIRVSPDVDHDRVREALEQLALRVRWADWAWSHPSEWQANSNY